MIKLNFFIRICFLIFILLQGDLSGQWTDVYTGYNRKLNDISDFWICGDSGLILRSTDNGLSWFNNSGIGIPANVNLVCIRNIYHYNNQYLSVCGNSASGMYLFTSSDSGSHWSTVFSQSGGTALGVGCYILAGNPVGGRWSIWKTNSLNTASFDSTNLYLPQIAGEHGYVSSFVQTGDCDWQYGFGTNSGKIYRRMGGQWYTILVPESNVISSDWVGSQIKGYIGGANLYKTTNFGSSWQLINAPGSGNFTGLTKTINTEYYIREDGKVYLIDSLGNISAVYTAASGIFTKIMYQNVGSSFYIFALRNNGHVTFRQLPAPPLGILNENTGVPALFSLYQNYPNPFNPSTKIRFDIPVGNGRDRSVLLKIYNSLGQEVAFLVNEQLQPGTYEVNWSTADFPSGVYYYKLTAGEFSETKKMVLIK